MPSTETPGRLSDTQRKTLLSVARQSIAHGLAQGTPTHIDVADYDTDLGATRASFVTLHRLDRLRGCIGHLEAVQPLVVDVATNAFAAAFRDPRFASLSDAEWPDLTIHLSILSAAQAIDFRDEADLLSQLRPGEDGLILSDGPNRGTFLPSVWESLPEPEDFFAQLKSKAGLAANHWSDRIQVSRYRTESFGEGDM